jgi:RepB DNA-primase from phage plasmid
MFDSQAGPPILPDEIRAHCQMIHRLAAPLAGHGKLVVARFGENPDQLNPKKGALGCPLPPVAVPIAIGDAETMVAAVSNLTLAPHSNVYTPLAVFRPDLPNGKKGFERDIVAVLGFVADFDDPDAARWAERLPLPPSFVLETSAGRFQAFYLFDKPEAFETAKPVAVRLKAYAGCDHGSADLSHVWRIAGTLNWPNAKKVGAGRSREPQTVRVVKEWGGTAISFDALAAALPASDKKPSARKQEGEGATCNDGHAAVNAPADDPVADEVDPTIGGEAGLPVETIVGLLPPKLRDRIISTATGDRSRDLFYVISGLISGKLDDSTIERVIRHYPGGIGAKYADRTDLDREIRRVREKSSRRDEAERDAARMRGTGRPILQVAGGALPNMVDTAELLLIERDIGLYEFGDQIVRTAIEPIRIADGHTTPGLRLIPVGINHLIEWKRGRPQYVADCLTVLRAYIVAGAPEQTRPLGSFEGWSRLVRDALVWLGEADPVEAMERTRTEDPLREALAVVLTQWRALLGLHRVSVKEVIEKATDYDPPGNGIDFNRRRFLHPEFREALLAVAGDNGSINGKRLGKWLSANKGKVVSDLRVVSDGIVEGVGRYRLQHFRDGQWE